MPLTKIVHKIKQTATRARLLLYRMSILLIETIFVWVPSHIGIKGNDIVDVAAKTAAGITGLAGPTKTKSDAKNAIKHALIKYWHREWGSEDPANKLKNVKPTIQDWKTPYQSKRREETTLCRLSIGHTRLTQGFLMSHDEPPICMECPDQRLTVQHLFMNCSLFETHRNKFQNQNLASFIGDDETNVQETMKTQEKARLIHKI